MWSAVFVILRTVIRQSVRYGQASAQETPMHTIDVMKLTPYQREVLTTLTRRLAKNDVMRILQLVKSTPRIHSALLRAYAVEEISREPTLDHTLD